MNRSLVITRYATALVKYVQESGEGEVVSREAETLVNALAKEPEFSRALASRDVLADEAKHRLVSGALGGKISDGMSRFATLVISHGRGDVFPDILRNFITRYYRSIGVRKVRLTITREPSKELMRRFYDLVKSKTGDKPVFEVVVDPSLVGGFILDLEDTLLDASVKRQLDIIRNQFIIRNRRLV